MNSIFPAGEDPPADDAAPAAVGEDDEKLDPREAYLPNVVGPRIRNALGGGQGLGSSRRYGMIVALLVGLASLPSWIVLRSGIDEILPAERMTSGTALRQPLPEMPLVVSAPRARTRHLTQVEAEELVKPVAPVRPAVPPRAPLVLEHGAGQPGTARPVAPPKKKVVRKTKPVALVPPAARSRVGLPKRQRPCGQHRSAPRRVAQQRLHRQHQQRVQQRSRQGAQLRVQGQARQLAQRQARQQIRHQVRQGFQQHLSRHSHWGVR